MADSHGSNSTELNGLSFNVSLKSNPTKKLIVKNLKQKPILPDNYLENTQDILYEAVIAIQTSTAIQYSLEELYQAVENMCKNNLAATLYNDVVKLVEAHNKDLLLKLTEVTNDEIIFLKKVNYHWLSYCEKMLMIRSIFLYLDRTYVLQTLDVNSLWNISLNLFYHHIMLNTNVRNRTIDGLLLLIEKERQGDIVDKTLLKSLIRMLSDLKMYQDAFDGKFQQVTEHFYSREGLSLIFKLDVSEYLNHVEKRLNEENERLSHYLNTSTKWSLIHTVAKLLIGKHLSTILSKGLEKFLSENKLEDLKLMYSLLTRVKNGLTELCIKFNVYTKKHGKNIVVDTEKDKTMVQELLDFKNKMDNIVENCFQANEMFENSLKEAFEHFINQRANKPAELIAKFIDSKLKVGSKGVTDEELEKLFDKLMALFRFIRCKDIFKAFYKKDFAKRLLLGKSASADTEQILLSKLKQQCGGGFTSELEGMFKDMAISKGINVAYKQYLKYVKDVQLSGINMTVNILTIVHWPSYAVMEVTIPNEMILYQNCFENFYLAKNFNRKVLWQHNLGNCVLRSYFKKGTKELQVSLFQGIVLLLFNESQTLSFNDIKTATNMEVSELKRTLQSLACGKVRVLIKVPKGRDIGDMDQFSVNNNFCNKLYKIKINQVQMKETNEEQKGTKELVYKDRKYQIDAAIVRIMKTRKSIMHNRLIGELLDHLNFPVEPADIKKRIESLMDREYMERDKYNLNQYNYIA